MNKSDILILFDYNYWANARVLDAAVKLTHDQFVAPANLSHGSLCGTLVHALSAEYIWRMRCLVGISPSAVLSEQDFPTFPVLQSRWRDEERAMRTALDALTDEKLQEPVHYSTTKGMPMVEPALWHLLAHVVNHGTQTRTEAGIALTAYGQSPGDLDMILFFRER